MMDPQTGKIYSNDEMALLDAETRKHLVEMTGFPEDVERIGRAVQALNRKERRKANRDQGLKANGDPKGD